MDAKLVGLHKVKKRLANGERVIYYYAWRGGPRLLHKPGTLAFIQEFARLSRDKAKPEAEESTVGKLVEQFSRSADFQKLSPNTKRDYERILQVISLKWGTMPTKAAEARGTRTLFLDWRDSMRDAPRSADMHMSVLGRIFSWAKHREIIIRNPLERIGRLHKGTRKDDIWRPSQLETILSQGSTQIANVVKVALWTMQRQGDVLALPTLAYDDGRLWIKQGKTGARVRIRPANEILPILNEAREAKRATVLVNSYGDKWTASGFRASLRKEMAKLGIKGVRFHDLRGTAITYAYAKGVEIERIAEISGHSKGECEAIIRRHYLAGEGVVEAIRAGTKGE